MTFSCSIIRSGILSSKLAYVSGRGRYTTNQILWVSICLYKLRKNLHDLKFAMSAVNMLTKYATLRHLASSCIHTVHYSNLPGTFPFCVSCCKIQLFSCHRYKISTEISCKHNIAQWTIQLACDVQITQGIIVKVDIHLSNQFSCWEKWQLWQQPTEIGENCVSEINHESMIAGILSEINHHHSSTIHQ